MPAAPLCSQTQSGLPQRLWFFFSFLFLSHSLIGSFFFIHIPSCSRLPSPRVASVASPLGHASPLVTRRPFAVRAPRHASPVHRARPLSCIAPSPHAPSPHVTPSPHAPLVTRRLFTARTPRHTSPLRCARPSSRVAHRVSPRHTRRSARNWSGGGDKARAGWSAVQAKQ